MSSHKLHDSRSLGSRIEAALTWLGGADRGELGERHERSTHAIAGVIVLLNAVLAWLVATLAVAGSTSWSVPAILPLTLVFGLLVGAVTRAIASGPRRGWSTVLGRGAVAVVVGLVVGELAALVFFAGAVDQRLDEQAARTAASVPAVAQASNNLDRTRTDRLALDAAVDQARVHRDQALVVARCEYNPSPTCPETKITGVPGVGPETRTANDFLADAQRELDSAVANRDQRGPALDAAVTEAENQLAGARDAEMAAADRGFGTRWVAMQKYTVSDAAALLLQMLTIAFFALLSLLPLILRVWRGETSHDRAAAARAERDRAQLEADTAIAVKQAEVRAAAEILWAEQQLANARLAVAAQTEIDEAQQRRRVAEAVGGPVHVLSQRTPEPVEEIVEQIPNDDMYLPIAAEAEAVSRGVAELPAPRREPRAEENLPARVEENQPSVAQRSPAVPTIPDVTKAAARWIRPLVPTFVARAIDTTTHPLRAARQVFEEFEEITFSLKRTHKVTIDSEESAEQPRKPLASDSYDTVRPHDDAFGPRRVESSIGDRGYRHEERYDPYGRLDAPAQRAWPDLSAGEIAAERERQLVTRTSPRELSEPTGPRQLPPGQ